MKRIGPLAAKWDILRVATEGDPASATMMHYGFMRGAIAVNVGFGVPLFGGRAGDVRASFNAMRAAIIAAEDMLRGLSYPGFVRPSGTVPDTDDSFSENLRLLWDQMQGAALHPDLSIMILTGFVAGSSITLKLLHDAVLGPRPDVFDKITREIGAYLETEEARMFPTGSDLR